MAPPISLATIVSMRCISFAFITIVALKIIFSFMLSGFHIYYHFTSASHTQTFRSLRHFGTTFALSSLFMRPFSTIGHSLFKLWLVKHKFYGLPPACTRHTQLHTHLHTDAPTHTYTHKCCDNFIAPSKHSVECCLHTHELAINSTHTYIYMYI